MLAGLQEAKVCTVIADVSVSGGGEQGRKAWYAQGHLDQVAVGVFDDCGKQAKAVRYNRNLGVLGIDIRNADQGGDVDRDTCTGGAVSGFIDRGD